MRKQYSLIKDKEDIVGLRINNFLVLNYIGKKLYGPKQKAYHSYLVECVCGSRSLKLRQALVGLYKAKSCGCLVRGYSAKRYATEITKHGKSGSLIYKRWRAMITRCNNASQVGFKSYGGRGITVCDRWLNFNNFYKDMGEPPFPGATLDRIDNNANYEPTNCKWSTRVEQGSNKRNNRMITFQGETRTLSEWARKTNLPMKTLWCRIFQRSWSVERALSEPLFCRNRVRLTKGGE